MIGRQVEGWCVCVCVSVSVRVCVSVSMTTWYDFGGLHSLCWRIAYWRLQKVCHFGNLLALKTPEFRAECGPTDSRNTPNDLSPPTPT